MTGYCQWNQRAFLAWLLERTKGLSGSWLRIKKPMEPCCTGINKTWAWIAVLLSQLVTLTISQRTCWEKKPQAKQVSSRFSNSTAIHSCKFPGSCEDLDRRECTAMLHSSSGHFCLLHNLQVWFFRIDLCRFKSEVRVEISPNSQSPNSAFDGGEKSEATPFPFYQLPEESDLREN